MVAYVRRSRRVRLVLAALCLGVMALFFHASYCQVSDVTVQPHAVSSVSASPTAEHSSSETSEGHEAPEQCQHSEHAVLHDAAAPVHAPDSVLVLLGLLALVTPALCLGLWERLRVCLVVSPRRPVPLAGRGLLTHLCVLRT